MNDSYQIRYDRQIRLWGEEGQNSIQQARVCVFGSSALATETLKCLVLAGIGQFHVIDDVYVTQADLAHNFFLCDDSIGHYRAECVVKYLQELNPSVYGHFSPTSLSSFGQKDYNNLLNFSIVIGTNMTEQDALKLKQFLYENDVSFIHTRVYGMIGYLHLCFKEHTIWNNHTENDPHDLRLDCPFDKLIQLSNATNLETMSHEQHSHTPYILLYLKMLDKWRETNDAFSQDPDESFPNIYALKTRLLLEKILMDMRMPDDAGRLDEDNFDEAKQNLFKSLGKTKVPENVQRILADPKISSMDYLKLSFAYRESLLQQFWLLCAALKVFVDGNDGRMPISGKLPDMTSDTKRYTQLINAYRKKAHEDSTELHAIANAILSERINNLMNEGLVVEESSSEQQSAIESVDVRVSVPPCPAFLSQPATIIPNKQEEKQPDKKEEEDEDEGNDNDNGYGNNPSSDDSFSMPPEPKIRYSDTSTIMSRIGTPCWTSSAIAGGTTPGLFLGAPKTNLNISQSLVLNNSFTGTGGTEDDDGELSRMSVSSSNEVDLLPPVIDGFRSFTWSRIGPRTIELDRPKEISFELCQQFCKNASKIAVQYGDQPSEGQIAKALKEIAVRITSPEFTEGSPPRADPLAWYILLSAADVFFAEKGYFPGTSQEIKSEKGSFYYQSSNDEQDSSMANIDEKSHLRQIVVRLLGFFPNQQKDIQRQEQQQQDQKLSSVDSKTTTFLPDQMLDELCRYGSTEPHVIAAMVGGCAAQEAIKLCTHQYIPVDNSLIFDGHSQKASTFRI